jgi:hypothetical protein
MAIGWEVIGGAIVVGLFGIYLSESCPVPGKMLAERPSQQAPQQSRQQQGSAYRGLYVTPDITAALNRIETSLDAISRAEQDQDSHAQNFQTHDDRLHC